MDRGMFRCKICGSPINPTTRILIMDKYIICQDCDNELNDYYENRLFTDTLRDTMKYRDDFNDFYSKQKYNMVSNKTRKTNKTSNSKVIDVSSVISRIPEKFDFVSIYNKITKRIIGQDKAVRAVQSTIIRNSMTDDPQFKSNIFLIGGTRKWKIRDN